MHDREFSFELHDTALTRVQKQSRQHWPNFFFHRTSVIVLRTSMTCSHWFYWHLRFATQLEQERKERVSHKYTIFSHIVRSLRCLINWTFSSVYYSSTVPQRSEKKNIAEKYTPTFVQRKMEQCWITYAEKEEGVHARVICTHVHSYILFLSSLSFSLSSSLTLSLSFFSLALSLSFFSLHWFSPLSLVLSFFSSRHFQKRCRQLCSRLLIKMTFFEMNILDISSTVR